MNLSVRKDRVIFILSCLCLYFIFSMSQGQASPPTQYLNASSAMGMGQSGRGVARGNSGFIYNPAGMSASITYAIEAFYQRTSSELNILGVSVVDSKMRANQDRLALGLAYGQVLNGVESSAYEGRLAFALPVIKAGPNGGSELHIGAGGRYLYDDLTKVDDFDVDVGALLNLGIGFNIGVVADSLLESNHPQRFGGGIGFVHQSFTIAVDYLKQPSNEDQLISGGAELLLGQSLILRGGYERHLIHDDTHQEWISGGIAILDGDSGRGQLSTAYRHNLSDGEYIFNLSLILFIDLPNI